MSLRLSHFSRSLFRLRETVDDYMPGAYRNAGLAARTLGVVEYRQVVNHSNRTVRAFLCTHCTADTADLTGVHNFLTLTLGRACNVDGGGGRYSFDYLLRASRNATATANTHVGVDFRYAVHN